MLAHTTGPGCSGHSHLLRDGNLHPRLCHHLQHVLPLPWTVAVASSCSFCHFSVAHLSFSSLDSLLCHSSASNFSCCVISVDKPLWSLSMCVSLSALTLKIFRHSPQMKMCLSMMWLSSSLLVLNPFTHSVHAKYFSCFVSSLAFSFLHSLCSIFSSLRLCISSSCSSGWSPPCFCLPCSSKSSAVGETS